LDPASREFVIKSWNPHLLGEWGGRKKFPSFAEHKGLQKRAARRWYQSELKVTTKSLWNEFPTLPVSFTCRCGIHQFPVTSVCVLQYQDMRHD